LFLVCSGWDGGEDIHIIRSRKIWQVLPYPG
jgi:hypothetical protein